jgi:hypothetical protein
MSGAAAIAAAKNRRGRIEANQKQLPPPISCGKNNSCPPQQNKGNQANKSVPVPNKSTAQSTNELFDSNTLQILGPLPPAQILRLHEQRLNKLDERCSALGCGAQAQTMSQNEPEGEDISAEFFGRIDMLENKLTMLEEVIMNLQNKLTIAQNFAMEMSMLSKEQQKKLDNVLAQVQAQVQTHLEAHVQITDTSTIDITSTTPTTPTEITEANQAENISIIINEQ